MLGKYTGSAAAELVWLKAQIVTGPAPCSRDATTPFGYSVVALRDRREFERLLPYVKNHMDEKLDTPAADVTGPAPAPNNQRVAEAIAHYVRCGNHDNDPCIISSEIIKGKWKEYL